MSYHRVVHDSFKIIPVTALERLLTKKLKTAGVRQYKAVAKKLAAHTLSESDAPFRWGSGEADKLIEIVFDDEDAAELEKISTELAGKIPEIMRGLTKRLSVDIADSYFLEWQRGRYQEERELNRFKNNIEDRWGAGLDNLRTLLEISRQTGARAAEKLSASKARKGRRQKDTILRLHIRACQVAAEILVLMENGFADGAMARWRTLHEIAVIALILSDNNDDVAQRYIEHEAVEAKKASDRFAKDYKSLGYRPLSQKEIDRVDRKYALAISKYGQTFKTEYGWAASITGIPRPRFIDLQDLAGKGAMHSFYKMASYNVHATSKSLSQRVGNLYDDGLMIAGATNAGIDEPGVRLADSLALITYLVPGGKYKIDNAVEAFANIVLRDRAIGALIEAGQHLLKEDREIRRAIADFEIDEAI